MNVTEIYKKNTLNFFHILLRYNHKHLFTLLGFYATDQHKVVDVSNEDGK